MITELVSHKHPILKTKSRVVTIDDWNKALVIISKLEKIMLDNPNIQGISSNQIGEDLAIVSCRFKDKVQSFINPELVWFIGSKKSLEGCISFKGRYFVKRPLICKVTWFDSEINKVSKIFTYKKARKICHEIDHINGRCINDIGVYWKFTEQAEQIDRRRKEKKCQRS